MSEDEGFFTEIVHSFNYAHTGAIIVTIISLAILFAFNKVPALKKIKVVPGALIVVVVGIILNQVFISTGSSLAIIGQEHLVTLPTASSFSEFIGQFNTPDLSAFADPKVWVVGVTIAVVASIETLLCLEAGDKMDPLRRFSSANVYVTPENHLGFSPCPRFLGSSTDRAGSANGQWLCDGCES